MNDQTDSTSPSSSSHSHRPVPTRPPIQWPGRENREAPVAGSEQAAAFARQQVERVHARPLKVIQPLEKEESTPSVGQNEHTTNAVAQEPQQHVMRQEPYDWQRYHTAWQQYYHQYFYRYYAGWWQQQKQQLEQTVQSQTQAPQIAPNPDTELSEKERAAKELREKVRSTIEKQSKKVTASSHFRPVIAALVVGGSFLLLNYNQVLVGAIKQYVAPGSTVTTPVIVEPNAKNTVSNDPKIIIPKIGVDVPVVYDEPKVDEASYQKALERGVVRLGNTANPGTKGNVVIGGHSSNNVFNPGKYKYVFVNLKRLDVGDIFYLNFNGIRYTYKVTIAKKIITPQETEILSQTETPTVTLFICDPPGTNVNRLIVQAQQIDPDPSGANANNNQATTVNKANPLPSVAPSLWDRLFH